jgi:DNA-binding NarL/FixJ family response regulator
VEKHRVLLLSAHPLLSEGLANLLSQLEDVILLGPRDSTHLALTDLIEDSPDVVLFAEQDADNAEMSTLMIEILQRYADLPVIQVDLAGTNIVRVYRSQTLPARSADLIEIIRNLPARQSDHTADGPEES